MRLSNVMQYVLCMGTSRRPEISYFWLNSYMYTLISATLPAARRGAACQLGPGPCLRHHYFFYIIIITFEHTAPVGAQLTYVNTVLKPAMHKASHIKSMRQGLSTPHTCPVTTLGGAPWSHYTHPSTRRQRHACRCTTPRGPELMTRAAGVHFLHTCMLCIEASIHANNME
jgi:hypothetical protein